MRSGDLGMVDDNVWFDLTIWSAGKIGDRRIDPDPGRPGGSQRHR